VNSRATSPQGEAIRIGIIGTGQVARQVHLPVLTSMPGVRVAWVADVNAASAAAVARAFKLRSVPLPLGDGNAWDCDVVLLASPVGTRGPYLAQLAKRGIAAFVEKPFARTMEEYHAYASLFPPHRIGCGFMRRTFDSTRILRDILSGGWLGRPERIVVREGGRTRGSGTDRSYFDDKNAGGGILLELGCHALDIAMHLTGATRYRIVRQTLFFDGSPDRVAEGEVLLFRGDSDPQDPLPLEFQFSWLDDLDCGMEIHFASARLLVGHRAGSVVRMTGHPARSNGGDPYDGIGLEPRGAGAVTINQAFYLEWRDFLEGLDGTRPSAFTAESALPVTALIADLYRAERER